MKKILLSFLALIAMVGMVSAQRTWAYGLNMSQEGDNYTFVFKSTTAATAANLVFTDAAGELAGKVALENVVAGENTKVLALADIPGEGTLNWAVELTGAAIEGVVDLTADAADKYYYYLPQGVAVNVNPESSYFGNIYVAEPYAGANDGTSVHSRTQKAGIYVYDAALNIENYAEGYVPSNVTINATDKYKTLHRIVVDPVTDNVVFTQSSGAYVWSANPADLKAEATNLAAGLGIALTQSVCFDGQGVMYVMDALVAGGGTLYKVVDGVATALVSTEKWANDRNSLASDGHGGVWVGQNRAALDGYNYLTHVNAQGVIDYEVNVSSADEIKSMFPVNMNRGHIAYDLNNDVLAFGGGGKVTLFNVSYDETTGAPTLVKWIETPMFNSEKPAWNVDGLAFDYAGDLYVMCASNERFYKYALPTAENTCTTPAPKAQVVVKELPVTTYTISVSAENGTVEGADDYEEGTEVTLIATASEGYEFTCWTINGDTVSTENPYTFDVTANVALVANFKKAVEEHTITLSGLLKYSNEYRGYTTLQNVEGDTAFFVYNYVDGVPAYGEDYTVTANLGELTLEGTGSWKLIDELETITAVLYNEEGTAVYNVTVSAKAPEVHNLACTDALYVENISEYMSELIITGVIDEDTLQITVSDWQEATAGTYDQVMGALNDEVYFQPESAVVTIVDTKLTIVFSAKDELGNTYNVNVTATPKPNTPLVVENATFTVDGDNLTIQGQWETKSVVVTLGGWSTTKYGEYNAVLMTGTGEADDDIYAEFSAVLSKDGTTATLTGVAANWDGTKYDVTISGLAPAETPTALDNVDTTVAPVKAIVNGQLVILKDGVKYNAQGAVVK